MSIFEFAFTLFGLVLGLALAEILGGLKTAIQTRIKVRIGVLTPLLGLIVAFDLVWFWTAFWQVRDEIAPYSVIMLGGLVITGLYYIVAGLVFPTDLEDWPDYDDYFFQHKKLVFGGIIACNAIAMAAKAAIDPSHSITPADGVFFALMLSAVWLPGRRRNIALLSFIAVLYPALALVELTLSGNGFG